MENIENLLAELGLSREKRKEEHKFVKENIETVKKLNISEETKNNVNYVWLDHLIKYERQYAKYKRRIKEKMYEALSMLN